MGKERRRDIMNIKGVADQKKICKCESNWDLYGEASRRAEYPLTHAIRIFKKKKGSFSPPSNMCFF